MSTPKSFVELPESAQEFVSKLSKGGQAAVKSLRGLHFARRDLEDAMEAEIEAIHAKYDTLFAPLYEQRSKVLRDHGADLPGFWLNVLKRVPVIANFVQPHDEPILSHVTDITLGEANVDGFSLHFHFAANPYLRNAVLTKKFSIPADKESPADDMPTSTGTKIDWHEGKDVTQTVSQKKQRKKGSGEIRVVERREPQPSFFHFFADVDPAKLEEEGDGLNQEVLELMVNEADVGLLLREKIIPNAVAIYTGEEADDEDDGLGDEDEDDEDEDDEDGDDDDEDGGDDDDEDDDEEEEEEEEKPANPPAKKAKKGGKAQPAPECKTQ